MNSVIDNLEISAIITLTVEMDDISSAMLSSTVVVSFISLSLLPSTLGAIYKGFNYGAGIDFNTSFRTAQGLAGTSGFNSARLYTMIENGTVNSPTSAIPAAIATNTSLLLGLYCSAGQAAFSNETIALTAAIVAYGQKFVDLIAGISVGSEDLYRSSPVGIQNKSRPGDTVVNLTSYIKQTRNVLQTTSNGIADFISVGHVDTWQIWQSYPNISALISSVDFIGLDAYPYWQKNDTNTPDNGRTLFDQAYKATLAVAGNIPVWITETGWPTSGDTFGHAVSSPGNAQRYWHEVGCAELFGKVNTWWYTLSDAPQIPGFGVTDSIRNTTAMFDLSCSANHTLSNGTSIMSRTTTLTTTTTTMTSVNEAVTVLATTTTRVSQFTDVTDLETFPSIIPDRSTSSSTMNRGADSTTSKAEIAYRPSLVPHLLLSNDSSLGRESWLVALIQDLHGLRPRWTSSGTVLEYLKVLLPLYIPLVLGACCFLSNSFVNAGKCNADNCLRALFPTPSPAVYSFDASVCATYIITVNTAATGFASRASAACGTAPARYSSACSCRPPLSSTMTTRTTPTATSTTPRTTTSSTSSASSSPTLSSTSSATTSSTTSSTTTAKSCAPTPTDNVVQNGGFECGLDPWIPGDIPYSTHSIASPGDASTFAYEYEQVGPVTADNYQNPGSVNQDLNVTVGQTYVLKFRTFFDKCTPSEGFVGVMLNHSPVYTVDACDFGAGEFKDNTVTFTPSVTPFNLRFEFIIAENPAQVKIDNVIVAPAENY
ncbi:MAG: hypothetical protein Q9200_002236 [Gallowayella weberi]